ncbi:MAG: bifunctional (p)ppGpp synthetase/guanosine-3',5'-bis(diphosphate) 3'-pyrophosphohydrolase, partial [Clostridia bacterium]|nr:bifunctional (p)ppGpp synthetase/guanosine-3',5'-bis(diphosphate) 3'-pyrophosphohydrolase [Clostridia bacterium]
NKCVGAKVNDKMVPITSILSNGDVVEIITNPNSKGPSRDWLKICKTNEAKKCINSFFKKNMRAETIQLGKTMLENAIKEKGFSVNKLTTFEGFNEVVSAYNFNDTDEFYLNIGTNSISARVVATRLAQLYKKLVQDAISSQPKETTVSLSAPAEKQIKLEGLNNILIKFANCCHPMHGDDIIGFISAGRGVIVHRSICPNVSYFSSTRLIDASWKPIEEKPKKSKKKKENEKSEN